MRALIFAAAVLVCVPANAALVFSEDVGVGTSTAIGTYTGWQNNGTLTFTGGATSLVANSTPSDYAGASGASYVQLKVISAPTNFQISSINTSAYSGTFTLTFGAWKPTAADTMANLILDYSSDGTNYTPISIPAQNDGTATWRLLTFSNITLPTVSDLRLRWTNNGSFKSYYLDDISLDGTLANVPEASSFLAVGLVGLGTFLIRRLKLA